MNEVNEEQKKDDVRETIGLKLFDKENPEMITKVGLKDLDTIGVLKTLTDKENQIRSKYKYDENILSDVIKNNLVLRTSLNGWRSEQGVKIVTAILENEKNNNNFSLGDKLKNIIGRG